VTLTGKSSGSTVVRIPRRVYSHTSPAPVPIPLFFSDLSDTEWFVQDGDRSGVSLCKASFYRIAGALRFALPAISEGHNAAS
jgi:hypothetical protein